LRDDEYVALLYDKRNVSKNWLRSEMLRQEPYGKGSLMISILKTSTKCGGPKNRLVCVDSDPSMDSMSEM